jgi:hypothetical protein
MVKAVVRQERVVSKKNKLWQTQDRSRQWGEGNTQRKGDMSKWKIKGKASIEVRYRSASNFSLDCVMVNCGFALVSACMGWGFESVYV